MTSQTDHPISRRSALAGLGAGGLGLALANAARPANAQDATPELANHPVVGAWTGDHPGRPEPDHLPARWHRPSSSMPANVMRIRSSAWSVGTPGVAFGNRLASAASTSPRVELHSDASGTFLGS